MKNIGIKQSLTEIIANKNDIISISKGIVSESPSIELKTKEPIASSSFLFKKVEDRDNDLDELNFLIYG